MPARADVHTIHGFLTTFTVPDMKSLLWSWLRIERNIFGYPDCPATISLMCTSRYDQDTLHTYMKLSK